MSDPNKFINTYIDVAIASIHEHLNAGLQLKTQLKLSNELITEKEKAIASLTTEVENLKTQNTELDQARINARVWEDSHNAMKNKVAHMDTLLKQIVDMKHEIQARDAMTNQLKAEIIELKEPKTKSISKKKTSDKNLLNTLSIPEETRKIDDF